MKPVQFADTRGKLRALIQELPDIPDNAVCFHDKDGNPVAFLLSPHGLAKMLTDAAFPEPDAEKKKLLRLMDEAANEEWQKLMQPQPDPLEEKFNALFEDPEVAKMIDQYLEECMTEPTEVTTMAKEAKSQGTPRN